MPQKNGFAIEKEFVFSEIADRKKVFKLDFHKGKIDSILKNKFYYGIMVYRDKEYPHKYETIISEELYNKAQKVSFWLQQKTL